MLRRVIASLCGFAVSMFLFVLTANARDCWINAQTGQPVPDSAVIPIGTRPDPFNPNRATRPTARGPTYGEVPGADYVRGADGSWSNAATGQPVPDSAVIPIGTRPDPFNPNRATRPTARGPTYGEVPGADYVRVPCPPSPTSVEVSTSLGISHTSTGGSVIDIFSGTPLVRDNTMPNSFNPSGTGFTGGIGASATLGSFNQLTPHPMTVSRYAPEANNAYAAYFPLKAPPKPQPPLWTWGVDGNVYFFAGGDQKITGIPGGPFGTATGQDSFKITNNVLFTVGGFIAIPITQSWSGSLTGGFTELNQTVKYTCATFCAVAPVAPAFTASQDRWVPGGYIGGRLATPLAIPGLPAGTNIGIDYKHVFFGGYDVSLGNATTQRQVNMHLSPDMDLITARLGVPLR